MVNQAKDQSGIPQFRRGTSTITVDPNVIRQMRRQAQYSSSATFLSTSLTQSVPKRFSASYGPAPPLVASAISGPAPPSRVSATYPRPSSHVQLGKMTSST